MRHYVIGQLVWLAKVTIQLLIAMGVGVKWVFMTARLVLFVAVSFSYFLPFAWWYLISPNIIRRVAYRSSRRTKRRNLEMMFKRITEKRMNAKRAEFGNSLRMEEVMGPDAMKQLASALWLPSNCVSQVGASFQPDNRSPPLDTQQNGGSPSPTCGLPASELGLDFSATFLSDREELEDHVLLDCTRNTWSEVINSDDTDSSEDEEDKQNLHNRARLDIYLPISPDTLFCMMERQRCLSPHSQMESKKFPIVICISGGAWIVGCYLWGALVARLLAACGYAVFCPDYRNFPQSDMEGMVLDVSDAIGWVVRNASRYNGDLSNVTLTGQSAGAHLSLMSLISQAQLSAYASSGATPPTAAAYNVCRYNPRVSIQRYIGLSGIYDLQGLVPHFHSRGLYSSVLHKITGGKEKLARFSPAAYFDPQLCNETGETLPENIFDFLPAYMYFLHGDADCSAPVSESANIAFAMRDAQRRMARNRRRAGLSSSSTDAPEQTVFRGGKHGHGYGDVEDGNGSVCQLLDGEGRQCLSVASGQGEVPPAEIRWVKIPNASHTDPIVEEILVARRSSLVEFILRQEDYLAPRRFCGSRVQKEIDENDEDEGAFAALRVPLADLGGSASGVTPVMLPDAILPTCVPHESRPLLMRVASYVIPF